MAIELWGPLVGRIGMWESGWDGLDEVAHNEKGEATETLYRGQATFKNFGPVNSGEPSLHGRGSRTTRFDATTPFTDDTFSYDRTTIIEHRKYPSVNIHTDSNTVKFISRDD